ncbi:hypothetical protein [Senimuribacter intestinalis]|uniref:hypothetical protein n=1 Tax=Senimuribacter intestinalis TaxID=2941507 RepID=UPI00203D07A2|nr:hypothetical protein [Senimuribacter intestinalis]
MQGHFSVINKRGLITSCLLIFCSILAFAFSLFKLTGGGSKLWIILLVFAACFALISLLILKGVAAAGIDVQNGQVIFAAVDGNGLRTPQFSLADLKSVDLWNSEGFIENPQTSSLSGAKVIFTASGNQQFIYYPVAITYKQFSNLKQGLFQMKSML